MVLFLVASMIYGQNAKNDNDKKSEKHEAWQIMTIMTVLDGVGMRLRKCPLLRKS